MRRPARGRWLTTSNRRFLRGGGNRLATPSVRMGTAVQVETVLLDGRLVPAEQAAISVLDRAVLYGESLFETLKIVDEAPCLWGQHLDRLASGCAELGIPLDAASLEAGVRRLLLARPVTHGSLRIQVTGGQQPGGGRGLTASPAGRRPRVIAVLHDTAPYPSDIYTGGAAVVTVKGLSRSLPWLKSGSHLASVRAKSEAEKAGVFEALLTAGEPPELLEGSFTNVVLWDGQALLTPPADRALSGVTLGQLKQVAAEEGLEMREEPIPLASVSGNGLLLASSLLGVCFCATLDGRPLVPLRSLATRLQDALRLKEEASVRRWQEGEGGPVDRR